MLDQLIESKNNIKESAKRAKFLGTTFVLVITTAFSGVLWSLFAKNVSMRGNQFEISTMVAPVPVPEDKPQPPEPAQKLPKNTPNNVVNQTSRQANILQINESPKIPQEISVTPNTQRARPNAPFIISKGVEADAVNPNATANDRGVSDGSNVIGDPPNLSQTKGLEIKTPPPPPLLDVKKRAESNKKSVITTGGVMNGKAINLPKPVYSAAARAVNANGEVNVQITVDETGKVISASAVSGHPLLRGEAERAARGARFTPTLLTGQPVKVTGIIVYRFMK